MSNDLRDMMDKLDQIFEKTNLNESQDLSEKPINVSSTKAGEATKVRKEPTIGKSNNLETLKQKIYNSREFNSSERAFLNKILSRDVLNKIMKK